MLGLRKSIHLPSARNTSFIFLFVSCAHFKARSQAQQTEPLVPGPGEDAPPPRDSASPSLAALRRGWAQLIRRVYEIDPLVCPRCRGVMRVVAFITESRVIRRILEHLGASARRATQDRAPPPAAAAVPVSP